MFTWSFATHKEHSPTWYIVAIVIILMLVVYGIVEQLYLMSVVAFLFAWVYLLMENNSTPTTQVDVSDRGIQVGGSFFEYSAYSRFAIVSIADIPSFIRLYPIRKLAPIIDIPLSHDIDSAPIRSFLSEIMEEEHNNTASNADTLIHAMKL
jgi:hypothetical protein